MKKGSNNVRMPDEQVVAFLEEVLIEQGYMLPREPEHITREDLALYGKGTPRPLAILRQSFESLMEKKTLSGGTARDVSESLAMAARNGTGISEAIWKRMRADREKAEADGGRGE